MAGLTAESAYKSEKIGACYQTNVGDNTLLHRSELFKRLAANVLRGSGMDDQLSKVTERFGLVAVGQGNEWTGCGSRKLPFVQSARDLMRRSAPKPNSLLSTVALSSLELPPP